ncbi:cupin domain-containing protein [Paenibacillus tritici]|uniref:Cupin domain-containing protein n=1 Tax=Paenibacillus tritici TaxID=1873425 RepID=A0ABX2DRH6_9BACL|nr:cupin domain-containing protein [Paenibacillus tritici]NQX47015.1 cupin domain-containing protein [Paenibacillus tritici]QUL54712.1 cupin domain-containing protein [Paenibacillus tritici]
MHTQETEVLSAADMTWELMPNHIELYHREIVSAEQADRLGIRMSSILWEKLGIGGQVLPHYHDVVEIIHITVGEVKLLCGEEWYSYRAGDTFHVPAGVVHSVRNTGDSPSEQISIFVPAETDVPANCFFGTTLIEDIYSSKL